MRVWKVQTPIANGCNGSAPEYFRTKREAERFCSQDRCEHEKALREYDNAECGQLVACPEPIEDYHYTPEPVDFETNKAGIIALLVEETSPLRDI